MAPVGENLFKFGDTVYCADKGQVGIVFSALSPKLIHPYSVGFADGSSDVFAEHELVLVERPKA